MRAVLTNDTGRTSLRRDVRLRSSMKAPRRPPYFCDVDLIRLLIAPISNVDSGAVPT
jgi:hypothetical protein